MGVVCTPRCTLKDGRGSWVVYIYIYELYIYIFIFHCFKGALCRVYWHVVEWNLQKWNVIFISMF